MNVQEHGQTATATMTVVYGNSSKGIDDLVLVDENNIWKLSSVRTHS